jgi:hypothetical protein
MERHIKKYQFWIKLAVIIMSVLQPFILIMNQGYLWSISSYWKTSLQPLFILVNAGTSYFFFSTEKWIVPAIFLLLLTAFSVEEYKLVHNIFAALFFISCTIPLLQIKRFQFFGYIYLFSLVVFWVYGMLIFEIYCVLILGLYHLTILLYTRYLEKIRRDFKQSIDSQ